jgi:ubiquinone/menaquinone biosynthesis C-methylase UbiE
MGQAPHARHSRDPYVGIDRSDERETTMSARTWFFAATYDRFIRATERAGLHDMRTGLVADAVGDVLEIGGGTGANLGLYGPAVRSLTITEPNPAMVKRLERHVAEVAPGTTVLRAPAEDLPFEDDSFDTVVSTLVLCGVDDQPRAVREVLRVLRPGGRFLFLEHVRADDPAEAAKQDRLNWLNRAVVCCNCNRPTVRTIEEVGFDVAALEHTELPKAPPFARPAVIGTAVPTNVADEEGAAHAER